MLCLNTLTPDRPGVVVTLENTPDPEVVLLKVNDLQVGVRGSELQAALQNCWNSCEEVGRADEAQ